MTEIWEKIDSWPYEVSNRGRVRNLAKHRHLKPRWQPNGYQRVMLCLFGIHKDFFVHRLVCAAFHGAQPSGRPEVDHINNIRHDNWVSNLRWVTIKDNRADRRLCRGDDSPHAKLTEAIVRGIRNSPHPASQDRTLADRYGTSRETIRDVRLGKTWRHIYV